MHMEWYTKYRVKDLRECIIDIKCTHMCEYSDLTEKDEAKVSSSMTSSFDCSVPNPCIQSNLGCNPEVFKQKIPQSC